MKRKENLNRDTDTTLKLHFYHVAVAPVCFVILAYCRHSNKLFKRRSFYRCYAVIKTELVCIYFFATGTTWNCFCLYGKAKVGWCFKSAI